MTEITLEFNPKKFVSFDKEKGELVLNINSPHEWFLGELHSRQTNKRGETLLKSWKQIYVGDRGGIQVL